MSEITKVNPDLLPPLFPGGTAYELCEAVIRLMLAEPKRVDMSVFKRTVEGSNFFHSGAPACGTAGCFSGWIDMITLPLSRTQPALFSSLHARVILGNCVFTLPRKVVKSDCPCGCCARSIGRSVDINVFDDGSQGDIVGRIGTKEYAESVVARIREFMEINRDVLMNKRVEVVRG